ncbi:hypothetical protein C8F01DRAFT_1264337 [Mycena amicta]|nr:hypothetical protein C8F01DRAFT_1264337 [Mycena amicta]
MKFFAQTGLMGLVCRHDIVLFFVNMESTGEKQYYVFLLLEELFQHLPKNIKVGALYNITCQTHRSCVLWGVPGPVQGPSHLGGCLGFGGSNGESTERVWAKLSHLISVLRVSGYHQRNYTIDMQTERNTQEVVCGIAAWMRRRWFFTEAKHHEAEKILSDSGRPEAEIQDEWEQQKEYQTRPLAKHSKTQAFKAINSLS